MGIPDSMLNVDIEADRDALTDPFPHSTSFPIGKERCGDSDENGDGDGKITLCDSQKPKTLSVVADYPLETSFPWRIRLLLPSKQSILALLFGQLLSVLITCTGISSQLLAEFGVDAPTTQSLLNYVLLSGYLIVLIYRGTLWSSFKSRWWKYLILAFFDVEANYLVVKAYQFTTITSVTLLDCFTIPCVMALSFVLIKLRFGKLQYLSVLICLAGIVILVLSDFSKKTTGTSPSSETGSQEILGDALVLGGSFLYACSNLGQEVFVNDYSPQEYLGYIGVFGSAISGVQLVLFESSEMDTLQWSLPIVGLFLMFGLSMFLLYSSTPYLLILGGATLMNLSFLTSDVFSIIAGILIFNNVPNPLYFVSFFVIVTGLVLYNVNSSHAPQYSSKKKEIPLPSSGTAVIPGPSKNEESAIL